MGYEQLVQAKETLQTYYGYSSFRTGQEEIIASILDNNDALVVMPTGGGKSLCYQIPAHVFGGTTLVISPLIALMKDQVDAINQIGVRATYINSSLSKAEERARLTEVAKGEITLLYVAPERLYEASFQSAIRHTGLSLIAIDEAHCMSQWGHDFRPSYMQIANWVDGLPKRPPVVALTATATQEVAQDICLRLGISLENQHYTGFKRENLTFRLLRGQKKTGFLLQYVESKQGQSGIIYASTRKEAEQIYNQLKNHCKVVLYHGGLSESERTSAQEAFVHDEADVMIATNAFGMGINKADVRFVIHANMPGTVEAYYQEAGRAGRDGEDSECVLLYQAQDVQTQRFFIEQSNGESEKKEHDFEKLQLMNRYAHTNQCLEQFILAYFGDPGSDPCGKCSNCTNQGEQENITRDAQMVLSCVVRMKERFGKTMIAQVLTGSKNKKIEQMDLHRLPTYGLMNKKSAKEVQAIIDYLLAEEYIGLTPSQYPTVQLLDKGAAVLKGEKQVYQYKERVVEQTAINDPIFESLRHKRKELADKQGVAPYLVFSDKTLKEMARVIPKTLETMATISGVGSQKLNTYGESFLEVLCSVEKTGDRGFLTTHANGKSRLNVEDAIDLFNQKHTPSEIADELGFTEQTVVKHLIEAEKRGQVKGLSELVPTEKKQQILKARDEAGTVYLKPIKELLEDDVSYTEIRIVVELIDE